MKTDLSPLQLFILEAYDHGRQRGIATLAEAKDCGDGLLTYLIAEANDAGDALEYYDMLSSAVGQLHEVQRALRTRIASGEIAAF